jgi:ribosomal protein L11 methylase PrmA
MPKAWKIRLLIYTLILAGIGGIFWWLFRDADPPGKQNVIFAGTPPEAVEKMLELAQVTKDDVVYDLGCGDGRILIMAAEKYGCKAVGYDIDPKLVELSRQNAKAKGVDHLVEVHQRDIFEVDLRPASVIAIYLLPDLNLKLMPQLKQMKPGSRIVSYCFGMKGVRDKQKVQFKERETGYERTVYLWQTPLEKENP